MSCLLTNPSSMFVQTRAFATSLHASRCYSSSSRLLQLKSDKQTRVRVANNFNRRRADYKKAVGQLRKQYADEVSQQRATDEKAQAKKKAEETRKRLEHQRKKNLQSVKNAMRHEEVRRKRAKEFEEEIKIAQVNRTARLDRFDKAKRLLIQELEEESVHWLSTPEEVSAALDGVDNEQKLWARPGSFVGAPLPSEDADFWRYQGHTWKMTKNYRSAREKMMEELEDMAYHNSNLDESYWDEEKIKFQVELEKKAKLRALVREEGRKSLLLKQRQMMQDNYAEKNAVGPDGIAPVPTAMSVPSLNVLADYEAMDREGVKILEENPSKFFVFENDGTGDGDSQTMGKPIRLRDPVRDGNSSGTPYPELIGRVREEDARTEREKKRQEREERMWADSQSEASSGVENASDDELAAASDPVDYDKIGNFGDEIDLSWEEGLDPQKDMELLRTPFDERLNDSDVDWMIEKIENKIASLEEVMKLEESSEAPADESGDKDAVEEALGGNITKRIMVDERGREFTSYVVEDDGSEILNSQDTSVLGSLTKEQITALESLADEESKTPEDIKKVLSKVPGLTDEQIQSLVDLEMTLIKATETLESDGDKKE